MSRWFAVIDTAQDEQLFTLVGQCATRACLLSGALAPVVAAAAPYLVAVDEAEPLIGAWREQGAGRNWGILCEATLSLDGLRKHFRRFLQVMLPDGTIAQFRFYDPRVFAVYLPAAPADQLEQWFEGVTQFAVEGLEGRQHSFRLRDRRLFDGDQPAVWR